ncbi:hypothetical protein KJ912_03205 [Patescibacteria group bacterium]|nr:hypothetical protein [Patescibacteria group bacterium]
MPKQKTKSLFKKLFDPKRKLLPRAIEWIFILFLLALLIIGFSIVYRQKIIKLYEKFNNKYRPDRETLIQTPEDEKLFTGEVVPKPVDTTAWDTYQNKWYGFEIQHPDSWKNNTQYKMPTEKSAVYETIYKFRSASEDDQKVFAGYDVKVYSVNKVKGLENTNEVRKKEGAPEDTSNCPLSEETDFGPDAFHFQKVSVDEDNPCYEPAYFYSITKGNFIFNIIPAVGESGERFAKPEKETTKLFPEYKEAVNSFKFIPIVRPQAKAKPKITAKHPVSAKMVNGKLVCAKKNDKPRKSKQNKGIHMDMECCLDPDEIPNPWCTY